MLPSTRRSDHISRTTCSFGRRSRSRSQHPGGACDAQPTASARGSPPPTTTAASWGDPRLYPHLRRALRRTRRGTLCCDLGPAHEPRRRVCPWPHLPRRGRGASGRARTAAADHHGRLMWRSAALSAPPARVASSAPQAVAARLHGPPSAPADRRSPQHARRRSRAARGSTPPLTMATSRGASGLHRHLRRAAHPTRCGTPSCDSLTLHQPWSKVGLRQRTMQAAQEALRSTSRSTAKWFGLRIFDS